ncbi:MAG: response regulator [Candidatus Rokubacteria bacterium]|nr:response regulator [Candidatus Rokubacteria bacterium]
MDLLGSLTGLAQNVALLLSLTLLYSVVRPYWVRTDPRVQPVFAGMLFGLIGIAGMHMPIIVVPGVIADARVIPVLLAGPFGGPRAAAVAAIIASAYRFSLGGAGMVPGIGTILTAGALGVLVGCRWRGREREMGPAAFMLLGLALDAIVLAWAAALPDPGLARRVLGAAALPVGVFLPLGTVVLGMLLVNERRRHDERERLSLAQSAIERTADALFWIDSSGHIVNANPAAVRLTGYTRDTLLTMRMWDLDLDMAADTWRWLWATVRASGSMFAESRYRRHDGTELAVERSSDFIEYRGQEWISVFVRDITERKQAERDRARHLARERMLRAQAEEANVLKDQFLATLSHELRTPLTSILGYARLLRRGMMDERATTRALDVIERNARAQSRIVDDLLDVSSIVMRKLRLDRRPIDLRTVVASEVEAVRPEAESRGLSLRCNAPRSPVHVFGDPERLQQVIRNLLVNALKFTPAGGAVSVAVETTGEHARIAVRDSGQGIEPAFLPHVFDRFRQADSSMTRTHGGLGVGLAIVRHLIEMHDGRVGVESEGRGRGATFTIVLPLCTTAAATGEATARERAGGDDERLPDLGGVRVLVVEDETETRELVTTVLERCGADVTPTASAAQALAEVDRDPPDVMVTDIAMPDVDGFELIRRIRARSPARGGKMPAAALTAYAGREDSERARAAGFEAHLAKPFEPARLARMVAALANRDAA